MAELSDQSGKLEKLLVESQPHLLPDHQHHSVGRVSIPDLYCPQDDERVRIMEHLYEKCAHYSRRYQCLASMFCTQYVYRHTIVHAAFLDLNPEVKKG